MPATTTTIVAITTIAATTIATTTAAGLVTSRVKNHAVKSRPAAMNLAAMIRRAATIRAASNHRRFTLGLVHGLQQNPSKPLPEIAFRQRFFVSITRGVRAGSLPKEIEVKSKMVKIERPACRR